MSNLIKKITLLHIITLVLLVVFVVLCYSNLPFFFFSRTYNSGLQDPIYNETYIDGLPYLLYGFIQVVLLTQIHTGCRVISLITSLISFFTITREHFLHLIINLTGSTGTNGALVYDGDLTVDMSYTTDQGGTIWGNLAFWLALIIVILQIVLLVRAKKIAKQPQCFSEPPIYPEPPTFYE